MSRVANNEHTVEDQDVFQLVPLYNCHGLNGLKTDLLEDML
jgi:hypothetical protein